MEKDRKRVVEQETCHDCRCGIVPMIFADLWMHAMTEAAKHIRRFIKVLFMLMTASILKKPWITVFGGCEKRRFSRIRSGRSYGKWNCDGEPTVIEEMKDRCEKLSERCQWRHEMNHYCLSNTLNAVDDQYENAGGYDQNSGEI